MSGLLTYFFWLAAVILGGTTTSKSFINFCCLEVPQTAAVRTKGEMVVPFFRHFFVLRPLFPTVNVNIFEIFFLNMIRLAFYHNKSKYVAKFHTKF